MQIKNRFYKVIKNYTIEIVMKNRKGDIKFNRKISNEMTCKEAQIRDEMSIRIQKYE